jgi:hypothetical protein
MDVLLWVKVMVVLPVNGEVGGEKGRREGSCVVSFTEEVQDKLFFYALLYETSMMTSVTMQMLGRHRRIRYRTP